VKYYFASRYSDHPLMRQRRNELLAAWPESEVVSRWIDAHGGTIQQSFTQGILNTEMDMVWATGGHPDVLDVMACDILVSFGHKEGGGQGGRHVEFGMGMALGKRLVLIGVREHIFHTAPQVEFYPTFEDFLNT